MNTWKGFILPDADKATCADLATHARYMADLVGPEYVGCGFDFANYFDDEDAMLPGLGHAGEVQNFLQALTEAGFSQKERKAIAWGNAMRVVEAVLG